jgi:AmmeMemoRadiSam system protein B
VHAREHSLEVELPFLQRVAPHAKVVPLAVGGAPPEEVARVLGALWGGVETVIVVSSDLSHYLPYDVARVMDGRTAARIVALDDSLTGEEACGAAGLNGLLRVARAKKLRAELIDLRSSGDTAGSHDGVVGYGAFALYEVAS